MGRLAEPEWEHWVLGMSDIEDPTEITYFVVFAPAGIALAEGQVRDREANNR